MATQAQIDANRRNANKSTGPRTPEGKTASSRNALQHGLCAEKLLLDHEDPDEFAVLRDDFLARLRPVGPVEEELVDRIAAAQWRLRRTLPLEAQIYSTRLARLASQRIRPGLLPIEPVPPPDDLGNAFLADCAQSQALLKLARYEASLERSITRNLRQLADLQKARLSAQPAEIETAERTQSSPQPPTPSPRERSEPAPSPGERSSSVTPLDDASPRNNSPAAGVSISCLKSAD